MRIWTKLTVALTASILLTCAVSGIARCHNHLEATYVPWGIDEFELLGLTKEELTKNFRGKLTFEFKDSKSASAQIYNGGGQFILNLTDGKVTTVERMFIDGMGCHITGPVFHNQQQALEFSIDGLNNLSLRDPADSAKLAKAQRLLADIQKRADK